MVGRHMEIKELPLNTALPFYLWVLKEIRLVRVIDIDQERAFR